MSETVISLSQMPNWGGGFPRRHEFSTLAGLRNEPMTGDQDMPPVETGGYLDKFHQLADAILSDWGNEFVVPYFYGPPGTGKTHAAIALGRALIERGLGDRVAYKKFSGDMLSFAAYSQNPNHFAHPMYIFGNSPAQLGSSATLILDEYDPFTRASHFDELISASQQAEERSGMLIITSNVNPLSLMTPPKQVLTDESIVLRDLAERMNPDAVKNAEELRRSIATRISEGLHSRLRAALIPIPFYSRDHREETSFRARHGL